ncbi:hypothetical protein QFC21_000413 [Naganishia friedmannii]|uniref:Uncharacterized protein n=1 Tax=Naganishia friedmannii TaxID=89922 RepID=A0ACC2WCL2_9TREE|nr:hypothetical protein QFC21_000413 [Naganishia friedmannii]
MSVTSAQEILAELAKLEQLTEGATSSSTLPAKSSKATKSAPPLLDTLTAFEEAFDELQRQVLEDTTTVPTLFKTLSAEVEKRRGEVDKGLKDWYSGLAKVGKAVDKNFDSRILEVSKTYENPKPLFCDDEAKMAMDEVILTSMIRRGAFDSARALQEEMSVTLDERTVELSQQLHKTMADLANGDVDSALHSIHFRISRWTSKHHAYLSSGIHPSALPFQLHRARFIALLLDPPPPVVSIIDPIGPVKQEIPAALQYARDHLFPHLPFHEKEIFHLAGALVYPPSTWATNEYADLLSPQLEAKALIPSFKLEFCRLHGWPKEDPLDVVVELGSNGSLIKIDKARAMLKDRIGDVRTWDELPISLPLPQTMRYHSVFACPVSKEQATDTNPPKMLVCGHVIAQDSLTKLSKHGSDLVAHQILLPLRIN